MADLTGPEKKELLELARRTIRDYLADGERKCPPAPRPTRGRRPEGPPGPTGGRRPEGPPVAVFAEKRGVFVTLHRDGELRGCIGYPLPVKPLGEAVAEMAIAAAVEDPRFPAVTADELEKLDIEISVLTVPQKVDAPDRVRVGVDGIIISKGFQRGLLLPQVPAEQGWNLEQYISYGCRKAGLPADEWKRGVQIEVFQALVFSEKKRG